MNNKKLSIPILNERKDLTSVEKNIIDFINTYDQKQFVMSSLELSKKCFCSESAITRFAKKFSFSSYKMLVFHINKKLQELEINSKLIENQDNNFNSLYKIQDFAFKKTINEQNLQKIKDVAHEIDKARTIMILGIGSSNKAASELASNLNKIGLNIKYDADFHVLFPLLGLLNKKDVVIIFSNNMLNKEIMFVINVAHEQQIQTVVITSNNEDVLTEMIDHKIVYHKIHDKIKVVPSGSKISQFLVIDYIFDKLLNTSPKYLENLKKTNKILNSWREKN